MRYKQGEKYYPFFREPNSTVTSVDMYVLRDDGFYLDFNDGIFYNVGWTTKSQVLTEKTEGMWIWTTGWTIPSENRTYKILFKTNSGFYYNGPDLLVGNINDISPAQVNAEVDDVLSVDANVELSSIPSTTGTLRQMIQALFEYFRNKKEVNSTTETLYKENESTPLATASLSDNGTTFTKGEMS
jgi:hypothetical protein